ncbi:MAG TPA: threonine synthase [Tenuifilaceae bacterium]|nr:threonine synthase [Tenuifilaceae bacterium]
MIDNQKFLYKCIDCGKEYTPSPQLYLCPTCSKANTPTQPPHGVLKVIFDFESLKRNHQGISENNYLKLLPIQSYESMPPLRVGKTPLYKFHKLDNQELPFNLLVKDDSQNPTFSFKDRASAIVSAYAKENGINTIVAASTGNAGSSIAGICASQAQKAIVMVPKSAPVAKLTQIVMYGATIVPVNGTYDNAFDLSIEATQKFGWYNRNTAFNPLTIEGKKTVAFEIFDQLKGNLPDRIFVPVGDGVIISGVYKGFEDLLTIGLIDKIPTIVAVQAEGSSNIVGNLLSEQFESKPSNTIADSISVDIPRNFFMAKDFIKKYHGEGITVTDDEILKASSKLSRNTGIFAEPAAIASFAGLLKYWKNGKLPANSNNMILLTGSGLKDLKSVSSLVNIPKPIEPNLEDLDKLIK